MSRHRPAQCRCPFCDTPLTEEQAFCRPCAVRIGYCEKCGRPLPRGANECPECGGARVEKPRRRKP